MVSRDRPRYICHFTVPFKFFVQFIFVLILELSVTKLDGTLSTARTDGTWQACGRERHSCSKLDGEGYSLDRYFMMTDALRDKTAEREEKSKEEIRRTAARAINRKLILSVFRQRETRLLLSLFFERMVGIRKFHKEDQWDENKRPPRKGNELMHMHSDVSMKIR